MGRVERIGNATLYLGDCREILPTLGRVDAVVTDPPYGITGHEWDIVVHPNDWMNAPSVCFSAEPYSTALINAAPIPFKYDLVWKKNTVTNLENAAIRSGRSHERVLVFGDLPYTPQKRKRTALEMARLNDRQRACMEFSNPGSVLEFDAVNNRNIDRSSHPSQKPLELMIWLINSYTLKDQTILDPFMGSGTTGVAAINRGRRFVGIETDSRYFEIACRRIEEANRQKDLFIDKPDAIAETMPELLL